MSPRELNHVQFFPKYRAVKLCAPKERLTIFRKRAIESFGDMPEYGHNWARDTGNSSFGQGSFWKHSSDQIISPFKTLQHWKEPKYQQGKKYISGLIAASRRKPKLFLPERGLPAGLTPCPPSRTTSSFAFIGPPVVS